MIQRVQSLFLLLAVLSTGALLTNLMVLATVDGDLTILKAMPNSMLDDGIFHVTDHLLLLILVISGILLGLISIFQFRRRSRQVTLARLTLIANLMILVLAGIFFYQDYQNLTSGNYLIDIEYGVLSPILSIIFCVLAIRYIQKDEKLVRSMDRLR